MACANSDLVETGKGLLDKLREHAVGSALAEHFESIGLKSAMHLTLLNEVIKVIDVLDLMTNGVRHSSVQDFLVMELKLNEAQKLAEQAAAAHKEELLAMDTMYKAELERQAEVRKEIQRSLALEKKTRIFEVKAAEKLVYERNHKFMEDKRLFTSSQIDIKNLETENWALTENMKRQQGKIEQLERELTEAKRQSQKLQQFSDNLTDRLATSFLSNSSVVLQPPFSANGDQVADLNFALASPALVIDESDSSASSSAVDIPEPSQSCSKTLNASSLTSSPFVSNFQSSPLLVIDESDPTTHSQPTDISDVADAKCASMGPVENLNTILQDQLKKIDRAKRAAIWSANYRARHQSCRMAMRLRSEMKRCRKWMGVAFRAKARIQRLTRLVTKSKAALAKMKFTKTSSNFVDTGNFLRDKTPAYHPMSPQDHSPSPQYQPTAAAEGIPSRGIVSTTVSSGGIIPDRMRPRVGIPMPTLRATDPQYLMPARFGVPQSLGPRPPPWINPSANAWRAAPWYPAPPQFPLRPSQQAMQRPVYQQQYFQHRMQPPY